MISRKAITTFNGKDERQQIEPKQSNKILFADPSYETFSLQGSLNSKSEVE